MIYWGISGNSHDAAIAVFDNDKLVFASHTERFSKIKNDPNLSLDLISYVRKWGEPDEIFWYENPFKKTIRQLYAGQGLSLSKNNVKSFLSKYDINSKINYVDHHESHAAAAFFTSSWHKAAVLVVDSIGEWDTTSIWCCEKSKMKKVWNNQFPNSLGLFYSAMTQRIHLKPQEDEYILMGMAAYGNPNKFKGRILDDFFNDRGLKVNLHRGCNSWAPELNSMQDLFDIAAATQSIYEDQFRKLLEKTRTLTNKKKIAIAGGCALNCVANKLAWEFFDDVWIFPNPGDSGSCIGAVLAYTNKKIIWHNNYLGYDIKRNYPVDELLKELLKGNIVGIANGPAEFGPRALGNRSLLADPRTIKMRDKVNEIKQRQAFRPFAPAILEEFSNEYFDLPNKESRYMQYAVRCKKPDEIPAVVHADGTSRVQTVPKGNHGFRLLLERWYEETGCPVLLNTSLNIKGQPIVNDLNDAKLFQDKYNVNIY